MSSGGVPPLPKTCARKNLPRRSVSRASAQTFHHPLGLPGCSALGAWWPHPSIRPPISIDVMRHTHTIARARAHVCAPACARIQGARVAAGNAAASTGNGTNGCQPWTPSGRVDVWTAGPPASGPQSFGLGHRGVKGSPRHSAAPGAANHASHCRCPLSRIEGHDLFRSCTLRSLVTEARPGLLHAEPRARCACARRARRASL